MTVADSLTSHLKKWFQTHTPIDEMDDMVKAVLSDNVRQVRKLLRRVKKVYIKLTFYKPPNLTPF
ncbi:hypothetical protein DPMN_045941 [Dreissena polymorpha]|uniref:Uncharacterized protein n=1 Tax=Dreissena polymorpha TaxID=45954 RepID=A0A9D4D514_DREPO|nr:hypothetical protein DPMN_045941 [Dreissena polymorpha]